jgi:activating signal cointegrator complex subunit 3
VHIVGEDRGPVIEALVARTLRLVEQKQKMVRIVGLSATLPNYQDVALFLRVDLNHGMFFFDSSFRPVPLEQTFIGVVERNTMKRLHVLNELAYVKALDSVSRGHQVMIFVHSRKDAGNTARALLLAAAQDKTSSANGFSAHSRGKAATEASDKFTRDVAKSRNPELKELFPNGIGIHHAGTNIVAYPI